MSDTSAPRMGIHIDVPLLGIEPLNHEYHLAQMIVTLVWYLEINVRGPGVLLVTHDSHSFSLIDRQQKQKDRQIDR